MIWSPNDIIFLLSLCFVLQLQVSCNTTKQAANILIVSQTPHSTWLTLRAAGRALSARGHSVTVLMPNDVLQHLHSTPTEDKLTYEGAQCTPGMLEAGLAFQNHYWEVGYDNTLQALEDLVNAASKSCEALLHHLETKTTEAEKYNMVLWSPAELPCGAVLARYLEIPSAVIYIPTFSFLHSAGNPLPVAYYPISPSGFTSEMTFMQRVQNTLFYLVSKYVHHHRLFSPFDYTVHKYISNDTSTEEIVADTDLWLSLADFTLEFTRPTMPNVVNVAAFNLAEPKPLSQDLEDFMQSSGDPGVILFSLGSITASMPDRIAQIFLEVFARLPQKVIWKMGSDSDRDSQNFPPNVKAMKWVPQNDLLAHKKMKLFINHGGTNGIYESVYHGVPMVLVTLPISSELRDNTARAVYHGYGVQLDITTMTTEKLLHTIQHVLSTDSYKANVERAGRIMSDQPVPPLNLTMWWIEHVIKHDGLPHLRTRANKMPFYQYFLLDVMAFCVSTLAAVLGASVCACRLMYRKIKEKQQKERDKKNK
ncbi:UDP-glucuronosyltransferase 2C1-like [Branchiostoma floridae]|uniref:UDP-glucuronosyltransferase 2C1-like n=1 Tax=Branchiostoma floridae TaxID=7739 RepID=A0A9J7LKG6_BRAFL|nr:UDP-glucuronosyltransferase 2C1-like [Branchiostoma floridae]XP_035684567.1 UDP-glucuronosyltransferase 2C1-like [Branchiostoma floridae]